MDDVDNAQLFVEHRMISAPLASRLKHEDKFNINDELEKALKECFNHIILSLRHSERVNREVGGYPHSCIGGWENEGGLKMSDPYKTTIRIAYGIVYEDVGDAVLVKAVVEQPKLRSDDG